MHRPLYRYLCVAAIAAGATAFLMRAQNPPAESLAARVQRLEDTEAIRHILLDYGRFLDARDFASYSNLFSRDGEWVGGFGTAKGPAAIETFMEKNLPGPNRGHTFHLLTNFEIEVHGDTATAWSRWSFVTGNADKKPRIAQAGRYEDTLIRENGRWKFSRRVAASDLPF